MRPVSNGFFPSPSTAQTVVTVVYLGLQGSMEGAQGTKLLPERPFDGSTVGSGTWLPSTMIRGDMVLPASIDSEEYCLAVLPSTSAELLSKASLWSLGQAWTGGLDAGTSLGGSLERWNVPS